MIVHRRDLLLGAVAVILRRDSFADACELIQSAVARGEVSAACLHVWRRGATLQRSFGLAKGPDTVFLLASITKPMTATAVMVLVDRGELSLSDPVRKFIPEFSGADRALVTVRHLLTHTSGLPDMVPENEALRKRHAPLEDFVAATCRVPLLFKPGTRSQYQSMGILLAAEVAARVTGMRFPAFLKRVVLDPLEMNQTSLGLGGRKISDTAACQVDRVSDWDWNSPYWRNLGVPWGGAHGSAPDMVKLVQSFLKPDGRAVRPQTAAAMIVDQNRGLNEPFGIGWMVKPGFFGKSCSPRTFGHYGSTGTVAWADPQKQLICVLLTTKPAGDFSTSLLARTGDVISG